MTPVAPDGEDENALDADWKLLVPTSGPPPSLTASKTQTVNRVSDLTLILNVKQGLTTALNPAFDPTDPSKAPLFDPTLPEVRYAENLRRTLALVKEWVASGMISPLNQMATIHYAHWALFENDSKLVFTSNFDGTWDQYLRDFVIVANRPHPTPQNPYALPWMDLVWGNCENYPGTTDYQAFTDWVFEYQIETTLFFQSISDSTVRDLAWLRQFKQLFDRFDKEAQKVDRSHWPEELRRVYDEFKLAVNDIDALVVAP